MQMKPSLLANQRPRRLPRMLVALVALDGAFLARPLSRCAGETSTKMLAQRPRLATQTRAAKTALRMKREPRADRKAREIKSRYYRSGSCLELAQTNMSLFEHCRCINAGDGPHNAEVLGTTNLTAEHARPATAATTTTAFGQTRWPPTSVSELQKR